MRVLVACEFSGIVREAFDRLGYDAWSCDFLPSEKPGKHIQGDVRDVLDDGWDLLIAFPPCTFLSNSGVRWLWEDSKYMLAAERWEELCAAAKFFKKLLLFNSIPHIAIENPIPHKYALAMIGVKYDQVIQPYQFGEPYSKATCLWLRNLPKLKPTKLIPKDKVLHQVWKEPPSKERWKNRSRTYPGIATAMAEQWGKALRIRR